jgi:hypothetical protein
MINIKNKNDFKLIIKKHILDTNKKLEINILDKFNEFIIKFIDNLDNNIKFHYGNYINNKINIFDEKLYRLYNFLIKCIKRANDTMNYIYNTKYNIILNKNTNIWNIYIFTNMFFNLPFTLNNVIYIPFNFLNNSFISNNITSFTKTLIHEKIHVLQRANVNLWITYIKINYPHWIIIHKSDPLFDKLSIKNLSNYTNKILIVNPDIDYDFKYIYHKNNKYYYSIFHLNNGSIKIICFEIIKKNNDIVFEVLLNNNNEYDHPFEFLAYQMSDIV